MTQFPSPSARATHATESHLAQFSDEDMAYHEAGHAVVLHLTGGAVHRLSIDRADPRRGTQPASSNDPHRKPGLGNVIAVLVGGDVAGTLHGSTQEVTTAGSRVDYDQAFRAAAEAGFDPAEARAMIDSKWQRVHGLLQEPANWRLVEALALALLRHRTLGQAQIAAILTA